MKPISSVVNNPSPGISCDIRFRGTHTWENQDSRRISAEKTTQTDVRAARVRAIYQIHPLEDRRWAEFLGKHSRASLFHAPEWLAALRETYGYEPIVFTTTPPNTDLQNGMVFCRVESWLTGRRLVSLPFSDYCQPLLEKEDDLEVLTAALEQECRSE